MAARAGIEFDAVISVAVESVDALAQRIAGEGYFALRVRRAVVSRTGLVFETN